MTLWIAGEREIDDTHVQTESRILFGADRVALCFPLDAGFLFFATLTEDEFPDARPGPMPADSVLQIFQASFGRHPAMSARVTGIPWTGARLAECAHPPGGGGGRRIPLERAAAHALRPAPRWLCRVSQRRRDRIATGHPSACRLVCPTLWR